RDFSRTSPERHKLERHRGEYEDGRYNEPPVWLPFHRGVPDDASGNQPGYPGQSVHHHRNEPRLPYVLTVKTLQERGEELAERVHVEVVQSTGRDHPPHRRDREHEQKRRAVSFLCSNVVRFGGAPSRLVDHQRKQRADESGQSRDVESGPPSVAMRY